VRFVYTIDRYLTGTLKELYDQLVDHGIPLRRQKMTLHVISLAGLIYSLVIYPVEPLMRALTILALVPFLLWWAFLMSSLVLLLLALHMRLDIEGFLRPGKLYSHGHFAWGALFATLVPAAAIKLFPVTFISPLFVFFFLFGFGLTYVLFVSRIENLDKGLKKPKEAKSLLFDLFGQLRTALNPAS
jgi:hypothetical protein